MIDFTIGGIIFDLDETLLDNYPDGKLSGLHERARLEATHELGKKYDHPKLLAMTPEDSYQAFRTAKFHNVESATWRMLEMAEMVSGELDLTQGLHDVGLQSHVAIASSARRKDIDNFLDVYGLKEFIDPVRIVSKDNSEQYKPHPDPFDRAFRLLDLPDSARRHTLASEDDPKGIASAQAAGLFVCAITSHFTREQLEGLEMPPDLIADSYAEFAELLNIALAP
jgi:beta-phosphoglucomutase-like phosphatase (HAD superfamily)